jgi:hypothetical protein
MAHPIAVHLSVVPTGDTQKKIENTINAPSRLAEGIEALKKERADAETARIQSLSKDLSSAPLNVDGAIEKYKAWKAKDDDLAARLQTAEDLRPIIQQLIDELKTAQPEMLKAVLSREIEQLETEAVAEKDKAAVLQKQIAEFKALLSELETAEKKPAAAAKKS